MSARLPFWLLLAFTLMLGAWPARAGSAPGAKPTPQAPADAVLLMPLQFGGDIESRARTVFSASLQQGLDRTDLELRPPDKQQIETGLSCNAAECHQELARSTSTSHMLRARIRNSDRIYSIELEAIDLRTGSTVASSSETCEICGVQEVATQLADQGAALGQKLTQIMARRPMLQVRSQPEGARVLVDGELVGTTPYQGETPSGEHTVVVEHEGYIGQERSVEAVEGVQEVLQFRLQQLPMDANTRKRQRALKISGALSLSAGLAVAGAGVPFIVLHDRENQVRCDGDNVDPNGTCRWTYDTMALGLGLTISGAALSVVGTALLATWGARRENRSARARIEPRGLGFAARF